MYAFRNVARYSDLVTSANTTFKYVHQLVFFLGFYSALLCFCVIFTLQFFKSLGEAMLDMFLHR